VHLKTGSYYSLSRRKYFQDGKQRITNFLRTRKGLVTCHVAEFLIDLIASRASDMELILGLLSGGSRRQRLIKLRSGLNERQDQEFHNVSNRLMHCSIK